MIDRKNDDIVEYRGVKMPYWDFLEHTNEMVGRDGMTMEWSTVGETRIRIEQNEQKRKLKYLILSTALPRLPNGTPIRLD